MARGKLEPPNLDDRSWQDIVDQAKALIPTYAPNWTDHNPSDLGIALIELFAWMVEGMTYRLNRVPEKNLIEFLNLIGITRDPATPASTHLTYRLAKGEQPITVPKGHLVATAQSEENEAVIFETDAETRILSSNLTAALYVHAPEDQASRLVYENMTQQVVAAPLSGRSITIPPLGSVMLAFGFDSPSEEILALPIRLSKAAGRQAVQVTWHHSRGDSPPLGNGENDWIDLRVQDVVDGTEAFQKNGVVRFIVPAPWESQNPIDWNMTPALSRDQVDEPLFWIGALIRNLKEDPLELGIEHVLFNGVRATNALTVPEPQLLGRSSGKPFQVFELRHQPLYKEVARQDPFTHLQIDVREPLLGGGFGPWQMWARREAFPAGAGNYYRAHPVTGEIAFGNHDSVTSKDGHGSIPVLGSEIRARSYRYVAGNSGGNVPPETVTVIRTPLPGLVDVTNPGAASGGSDEESIEDTKRRAPQVLRNRDRAVTVEDYEYLAREATTDVRKVRCLPERLFNQFDTIPEGSKLGDPWTFGGLNRDKGSVNVIVIPSASAIHATPAPSDELLKEVSQYLDARRVLGTTLHITSPRYLPIDVSVDISIWNQALQTGLAVSVEDIVNGLRTKISTFLHPLHGGPKGNGWDVGQDFLVSGLLEFIQPNTEIGFISSVSVKAGLPMYQPQERPKTSESDVWVQLADYEIICSGTSVIQETVL